MKWLAVHLINALLAFIVFAAASGAFASSWEWFQLCKHETGAPAGKRLVKGFDTLGGAYLDTSLVTKIIPFTHGKCVLLELQGNAGYAVFGSLDEIWCRVHGGPRCKP